MITAHDAAKVRLLAELLELRNKVLDLRSNCVLSSMQSGQVDEIALRIDMLFNEVK